MKKIFLLFLILILTLSCGCGKKAEKTVSVTLPKDLFDEDTTDDEILQGAAESGFSSCVIGEDDTVTYVMTESKQQEMLESYSESIISAGEELTTGDEKINSFESIEFSDNYDNVKIYVDSGKYTYYDSISAMVFYISCSYYQIFNGVAAEDVDVLVEFIDNETKEVIDSASYKDWMGD